MNDESDKDESAFGRSQIKNELLGKQDFERGLRFNEAFCKSESFIRKAFRAIDRSEMDNHEIDRLEIDSPEIEPLFKLGYAYAHFSAYTIARPITSACWRTRTSA